MAGATTLTTADSILKEVYEDRIRDQLQSDTITLKRIEQTSEGVTSEVGGKYVTFPIRVKRNHGIGARNENEVLPEAKTQGYASARINLAYLYGSISLTGQTMELVQTNTQAFASALSQETEGLRENLTKDMNRQMYGTSDGAMAVITSDGSNNFVVDSVQYLEVGMIIDVHSSNLSSEKLDNREITAIDESTNTVTYDGSDGTTAVDDVVTRHNSEGKETIGFKEIVDNSGTLYNIDPTVNPVWKSVVKANGGTNRALSEGLMTSMVDAIRANGGRTSVIFTSLGVRRAYFNLLVQHRRYTGTTQFEGGFSGLSFTTDWGEAPVVSDFDCQSNRMYFINEKEIKLYREADWSFMDRDGSSWQRVITSDGKFDAYEAMMFKYCQLGTHRRNSHGLLDDITEPSA